MRAVCIFAVGVVVIVGGLWGVVEVVGTSRIRQIEFMEKCVRMFDYDYCRKMWRV